MKPADYVTAFKLDTESASRKVKAQIAEQLEKDFREIPAKDPKVKTKILRQKFDQINAKSRYPMSEGVWGFFYATIIVPELKKGAEC